MSTVFSAFKLRKVLSGTPASQEQIKQIQSPKVFCRVVCLFCSAVEVAVFTLGGLSEVRLIIRVSASVFLVSFRLMFEIY